MGRIDNDACYFLYRFRKLSIYCTEAEFLDEIQTKDSPLQPCLEISISSEAEFLDVIVTQVWRVFLITGTSTNAFYSLTPPPPPPSKNGIKLVCNVRSVRSVWPDCQSILLHACVLPFLSNEFNLPIIISLENVKNRYFLGPEWAQRWRKYCCTFRFVGGGGVGEDGGGGGRAFFKCLFISIPPLVVSLQQYTTLYFWRNKEVLQLVILLNKMLCWTFQRGKFSQVTYCTNVSRTQKQGFEIKLCCILFLILPPLTSNFFRNFLKVLYVKVSESRWYSYLLYIVLVVDYISRHEVSV